MNTPESEQDFYKKQIENQWNNDPCGSHYVDDQKKERDLNWFLEVERYRYKEYAPWMPKIMEFHLHHGENLLEIGSGMGTDLAQFAKNGANVTDVDFAITHLEHAKSNLSARSLPGKFILQDAEKLPFEDNEFDLIYSNGVIHHTPNTLAMISEIYRVLKPGGKIIIMVYAVNSLHFWYQIVWILGIKQNLFDSFSIGEIMSRNIEITENNAQPLVKAYTTKQLKMLFSKFKKCKIYKRQLTKLEIQQYIFSERAFSFLRFVPLSLLEMFMGWNLIIKAYKPNT